MRRRTLLILIMLSALAGGVWFVSRPQRVGPAAGTTIEGRVLRQAEPRESLRIGTFNIHGCTGADDRRDVARVARCLGDLDFAALNEVHGARPWENADQAALLGRRLGMQWLFAPATRDWHCVDFGNGLVTKLPVESWQRMPLAASNGRSYRNAVLVRLRFHDETVQVLLTHIARSDEATCRAELHEVIDDYLSLPAPAILLGDLNSEAGEPELRRLLAVPDVIDAVGRKLGVAAPPRIDWIFVRGLRVLDAGLRDEGASDHPLAWAEVAPRTKDEGGRRKAESDSSFSLPPSSFLPPGGRM
jgi:endonuclease/exonuclease/phosphatase family metal-dependent hydrolase